MNTNAVQPVVLALFLTLSGLVSAQETYQFGLLPAVNLNKGLNANWSLNLKGESRQSLRTGVFTDEAQTEYDYVLSDVSLIAARKVGLGATAAAGYLIRFRDGRVLHRSIQQFALVQPFRAFRLAHRLVSDQTFDPAEQPEFRLRYRISAELPLQGESVDPGEFYFLVSNEYLNAFQGAAYDLELRLVPVLGYRFPNSHKLELGLDYRRAGLLEDAATNSFWTVLTWFVKLP